MKVLNPSAKQRVDLLLDQTAKIAPSSFSEDFLKAMLQTLHRLRGHFQPRLSVDGHRIAQEFSSPRPVDGALLPVDFQLELTFQESFDGLQHPFPGSA